MAATQQSIDDKIKVAVVGAGLSGLAVANGLLNDETGRFDVQIYERDTIAFDSERGGYQIRIASNGLRGLKTVADVDLWDALRETWAGDASRAPAVVDPKDFKVHLELANLKAYPASRPVPRTGLRKALLRRPLAENRLHFDHKLERFEHKEGDDGLILHFDKSRHAKADILIAADGSNSQVNRQVGMNNKIKLRAWTLIQSRGNINERTRQKLPPSLLQCGSLMFLGGHRTTGFASIYNPGLADEAGAEKTWNLFWSILIPASVGETILAKANGDHEIVVSLILDYLRRDLKYGESLPTIMTAATQYLRTGRLTSSAKPAVDWREGNASNSRIILLGDAVHPMTPGRGQGANQALTDAGNLVKLFGKDAILREPEQAFHNEIELNPGPPGAPPQPHASFAAADVHVWPSLRCLMPGKSHADVPEVMDTGKSYVGEASRYACTIDITFGMKYGLLRMGEHMPRESMDEGMKSFVDYIDSPERKPMSIFDGGQLSYNFLLGENKTVFWNDHLGGYDGILRSLQPKPNVLIQAIAGRANLNGRPFDGSAAGFAVHVSKWMAEPEHVIWCLHDDAPIKPWSVDTRPATELMEQQTSSRVIDLKPGQAQKPF